MNDKLLNYGLFVCGVTIAIYCFGLLLFKDVLELEITLTVVFFILLVPPLCFSGSSEVQRIFGLNHALPRCASTILWLGLLAMYAFPLLVTLFLLPNYLPSTSHYFLYAPVAMACGLGFIRLHALGGHPLLILTGVTVEVIAVFFFVTRMILLLLGEMPASSTGKTFEFFTMVATGLSYVFLLGTGEHGFLKKALIWFGHIQDVLWQMVRVLLIALCLGACHVLLLISVMDPVGQQYIGIMLFLLSGLWLYVGFAFRSMLFYSFAYAEILIALFSCLFFDAIWSESWIIWLLLVFFGTIIPIYSRFLKERYAHATGHVYVWLSVTAALILFEHMTFYGFYSKLGLVPLFSLWIMVFLIPASASSRQQAGFRAFLGVLLYAPAIFFFLRQGPPLLMYLPRTLLTTVIISALIVAYRMYEWQWFSDQDVEELRIVHHLHWYLNQTHSLLFIFLLSSLAVVAVHVMSFLAGPELFASHFFSMLLVQGFLAIFWFDRARKDKTWWWTIAAEMMIAGIIFTLRQDLPLLFDLLWDVNWDLAVGVFVAFAITAARPLLKQQDSSIRIPIRFTLLGLPIITALYALDYDVGFDVFSRMLLIYSVLFLWQAYSEKDRFVLAYAFLGINSYLILLFLHNDIHSLQAYVTPVCISILILVQVFRDITSAATANIVRGLTLCLLLGMAAFEAIVQNSSSPLSHIVVIIVSILAIVTAILLWVKIFAFLGLLCFFIDLLAIIYIVLSQQSTDALKVILGLGFTLGGGLILSGYIFYRKNRESVERIVTRIKTTFTAWE